jgi:serine/threonine-protein kinase RsbW
MKPDRFEIELESKIDNLPVISDFVSNILKRFQADPSSIYKVQLAVDEACTNIINYAYPGKIGPLKIKLELSGEDIVIIIADKGKPFDQTSIPPPDLNPDVEQRKVGGLGFYLMRKMMDSISYSYDPREGNKLVLRKKFLPGVGTTSD